jgi:hypothetical protein
MQDMIPDKRRVVGLVEQAHEGKLCLPDFQRNFVWRRDEVADLIRSIMRGYFIGSLLLLRCDPQDAPFKPIFLRGANTILKVPQPELLILDGQQRLTALLYALTAPNHSLQDSSQRRWFFVDLDLLLREPDNDEIVFDRSARELDGLDATDVQYVRHILPCTRLLKPSEFLSWRDGLDDWLRNKDPEGHKRFREKERDAWTQTVNDFQSFVVPLVELPRVVNSEPEALGRICAIFEKLNSTGVELSVYDLLTARLYRSGIKLHDLWDEACKKHKLLNQWSKGKADTNKFGVLTLRTLALLRGLDPKPRFLINLAPKDFEKDWRRAVEAIERGLELLTHVGNDGFGVFNPKWLPGFGLLPVLAALRSEIEHRKLGEEPRADLRRWYWSNVFLERYSSGVESKSRKDYAELLAHWTEGQPAPAVFTEARNRIGAEGFSVRESASQASAVYSGVFCLLALRGARDWRRVESIQLQELQDHHIFPQDYLKTHGLDKRVVVNSIVNRTLISDETNGKIKNKAPAQYLTSNEIFPSEPKGSLLSAHFLESDAIEAMQQATPDLSDAETPKVYEDFCSARERAIVAEIRKLCDIT